LAVITHKRWRFDDRIDLLKLIESTEDGDGLVLEAQTKKLQRDRHASNVWRIKHSDKFHGYSCCG
jgi:hypothetical protein